MVSRIATYYQNQNSLRSVQQANSDLEMTTYQITSGNISNRLGDMAGSESQILNLRDVTRQTTTYQGNLTDAENFLKSAESALSSISDLLGDATSTAALGRNENSADTRASLAPKAQSLAETFYTMFNTQYNNTYVFSGQNGTQSPVSGTATATAFPGSPVPTTYYQGDSNTLSTVSGPGTTLNYGVLGNDPAFAQIKSGLESLWYGLQNNSLTDIDSALSTLQDAQGKLSSLLGTVGGQINSIDQLQSRYSDSTTFVKDQLDGKEKVDMADALTKFSQQQATLQSSLMIITQVNQLSLLNYLR